MTRATNILIVVLAVLGVIAVISVLGMVLMQGMMMGGGMMGSGIGVALLLTAAAIGLLTFLSRSKPSS